jgi:hypothetical protein
VLRRTAAKAPPTIPLVRSGETGGRRVADSGVLKRAAALTAAAVSLVVSGLAAVASADVNSEPVITWPTTTALNPMTSTYQLTVAYDGPEFLFLKVSPYTLSEFTVQSLPANGTADVIFKADYDGQFDLRAFRCPTATFEGYACTQIGATRQVLVYDELVAQIQNRALRGPATPTVVTVAPTGHATYDVEWEVVPAGQPDAPPLVSGVAHDVTQSTSTVDLPVIGTSAALVQGQRYRYQATLRGDRGPFGLLEGAVATEFDWDATNPANAIRLSFYDDYLDKEIRNPEVLYPQRDIGPYAWRDAVRIEVLKDAPEVMASLELSVTDSDGVEVWHYNFNGGSGSWNGRGFDGRIVPEGAYTVRTVVTDRLGNAETYSRDIRVSPERLTQMTREWTVSPKRTIVEKFVGRCASVQSPARAAWQGSIGLRSSATGPKCRTAEAQSVQTVHGIYLPPNPFNLYRAYDQIRVSTYGGGARGSKSAYLVHVYWSRDRTWVSRRQFDGSLEWHRGLEAGSQVVQWDAEAKRHYVLWSVGLAEGAKYDVKSYKIHFRYWGLRRGLSGRGVDVGSSRGATLGRADLRYRDVR